MNSIFDTAVSFRRLSVTDIPAISALENASWPQALQANPATIAHRMALHHVMLGAFQFEQLIGLAAWRYGMFDPSELSAYPDCFEELANTANTSPFNAAYAYNFVLSPAIRKTRHSPQISRSLINEGIDILIADGCKYLVGASRCPSYAGSEDDSIKCKPSSLIKHAIDISRQSSSVGDLDIPWQADPVLSFYKQTIDCRFTHVIPAFMPEDKASGGHAIGFYKVLASS